MCTKLHAQINKHQRCCIGEDSRIQGIWSVYEDSSPGSPGIFSKTGVCVLSLLWPVVAEFRSNFTYICGSAVLFGGRREWISVARKIAQVLFWTIHWWAHIDMQVYMWKENAPTVWNNITKITSFGLYWTFQKSCETVARVLSHQPSQSGYVLTHVTGICRICVSHKLVCTRLLVWSCGVSSTISQVYGSTVIPYWKSKITKHNIGATSQP